MIRRKLTYDFCLNESKKYKYYTEFRDNDLSSFNKSKYNGWLKDFIWLEDNLRKYDYESKIHKIYVYKFLNEKVAYVGRTIQISQRHYSHFHPKNGKNDVVKTFCEEHNIKPFIPEVLEDGLTLMESQVREEFWHNYYLKIGYKMLNKGCMGLNKGSIGGLGIKWTKENVEKEAKKYSYVKDFRKSSIQAYKVALKRGFIKEFYWLKRTKVIKNFWNKDTCLNAAKKYLYLKDFREKDATAYGKAVENHWLDEYVWLIKDIRPIKWTKEACYNEAKKCKTKTEFRKKLIVAYEKAKENKWLDEYTWFNKPSKIKKKDKKRAVLKKSKPKNKKTIEEIYESLFNEKTDKIKKYSKEKFGDSIDVSNLKYTGLKHDIYFICSKHGPQKAKPKTFLNSPCGCKLCSYENSKKKYIGGVEEYEKMLKYVYGESSYIVKDTFKKVREKCYAYFEHGQRLDEKHGKWVFPENIKQAYKNKLGKFA